MTEFHPIDSPTRGGLTRTHLVPRGGLVHTGEEVVLTDANGTAWRLFYTDANGDVQELALGTSGQVLKANGASAAPSFGSASSMLKTQNAGFFTIPTMPSTGTGVAQSGTANTYGSWVEMTASTSAAIYIVGVRVQMNSLRAYKYVAVNIGTGGAGAETSVGYVSIAGSTGAATAGPGDTKMLAAYIPVATSTRIACQTATDSANADSHNVTLLCVNQADVVAI